VTPYRGMMGLQVQESVQVGLAAMARRANWPAMLQG